MAKRVPYAASNLTPEVMAGWPLPILQPEADKEARGHVVIVAGSHEMPGAALLAAVAALRAGAGKLTIAAPERVAVGLALAIPEARVISLPEARSGGLLARGVERLGSIAPTASALVAGPGMLDEPRSVAFVRAMLPVFREAVVVLDALAMSAAGPKPFTQPVVMTPHAGEMAHLSRRSKDDVQSHALETALESARRWNACVALKGSTTFIALPTREAWCFSEGAPGLATSGSGDTLAGLVGGFAARGLAPVAAAAWGVTIHARAGHALSQCHGELGYLAREIAAQVPAQIKAACEGSKSLSRSAA